MDPGMPTPYMATRAVAASWEPERQSWGTGVPRPPSEVLYEAVKRGSRPFRPWVVRCRHDLASVGASTRGMGQDAVTLSLAWAGPSSVQARTALPRGERLWWNAARTRERRGSQAKVASRRRPGSTQRRSLPRTGSQEGRSIEHCRASRPGRSRPPCGSAGQEAGGRARRLGNGNAGLARAAKLKLGQ